MGLLVKRFLTGPTRWQVENKRRKHRAGGDQNKAGKMPCNFSSVNINMFNKKTR